MACPSVDSLLPVTRNTLNPLSINLLYCTILVQQVLLGKLLLMPIHEIPLDRMDQPYITLMLQIKIHENQRTDNSNSYATFGNLSWVRILSDHHIS